MLWNAKRLGSVLSRPPLTQSTQPDLLLSSLHEGQPVVADFGIARALSTRGTDLISRPGFTV